MPFNLSGWELLVILIIGLLLFGSRLPSVGKNIGKSIVEFKKGLKDAGDEASREDSRTQASLPAENAYRSLPTDQDRRVAHGTSNAAPAEQR